MATRFEEVERWLYRCGDREPTFPLAYINELRTSHKALLDLIKREMKNLPHGLYEEDYKAIRAAEALMEVEG